MAGIIGLQFAPMDSIVKSDDIEWESFPEPVKVEKKPVLNEDGEEVP